MLRSLYDFKSETPGTLNANADDFFCYINVDTSKQWVLVSNEHGEIGHVPKDYLQYCAWADKELTQKFLDDIVGNIHTNSAASGQFTQSQTEQLRILSMLRERVVSNYEQFIQEIASYYVNQVKDKRPEAAMQIGLAGPSKNETRQKPDDVQEIRSLPESQSEAHTSNSYERPLEENLDKSLPKNEELIVQRKPEDVAAELTELLRCNTKLPYESCKSGVKVILEFIHSNKLTSEDLEATIRCLCEGKLSTPAVSNDIIELDHIFQEIKLCKDDIQQRSWHLHEDEDFIAVKLTNLQHILASARKDLLVTYIEENIECIDTLVSYYQMETRGRLRLLLLQAFVSVCLLSHSFISHLHISVLPVALAADCLAEEDEIRLSCSFNLLRVLFSTGMLMPHSHNAFLNAGFVKFLIETIESSEKSESVRNSALEALLSFNIQYNRVESNLVMESLKDRLESTYLTEKILALVNRSEDPVVTGLTPVKARMNSVLKFIIDMCSSEATCQIFYTNDLKVLLDIVLRQLWNLQPDDNERDCYYQLLELLLLNSGYHDYRYRKEDIMKLLDHIYSEKRQFNGVPFSSVREESIRNLLF